MFAGRRIEIRARNTPLETWIFKGSGYIAVASNLAILVHGFGAGRASLATKGVICTFKSVYERSSRCRASSGELRSFKAPFDVFRGSGTSIDFNAGDRAVGLLNSVGPDPEQIIII